MSNIELVIKISKEQYSLIMQSHRKGIERFVDKEGMMYAIKNGVQLPKGHGDLKDADKLKHAFIKWSMAVQGYFTDSDIASIVYNSPTIIEADKAKSEGKE